MRQRNYLIPTLREIPSDAEAASHQFLLRGGVIRPLAAGIYTYLPLGRRILYKLETIIREEMDRTGAQEILMPAMQPAELWHESGRYSLYGPELIRLHDRNQREFALGPTHEEVVTSLVRDHVSTYRNLPMTLYQLQTKFRDERRPRFGLLRCREFLMKDAYSFALDSAGLDQAYRSMFEAYHRIFTRCGLRFRAVEADAGSIGGEGGTHEFMVLAEIGEDTVVSCSSCDYAANLEMAESGRNPDTPAQAAGIDMAPCEKFHTPGIKTIEQLVNGLGVVAEQVLKTLVYSADGRAVAVVIRGDHEASETKIKHYLLAENLELADEQTVQQAAGTAPGYIGPVGLDLMLLVDRDATDIASGICGANELDHHMRHVKPGRDFTLTHVGDFRNAKEGDLCPRCAGTLQFSRGIEVGHVFKLGTRYSSKLGARLSDAAGQLTNIIMGCYGIGVSRLLSAIAEQCHDEFGIVWPDHVAPFQIHVIPISVRDEIQLQLAEDIYGQLRMLGMEVMLDDRDERPGIKFKDADLIGIPVRVVIGRGAADHRVEYRERDGREAIELSVDEAVARIVHRYAK